MKVVGLTGGIGSGKSTVLEMFKTLGIPYYIADNEAKKLMNTSKVIKAKLISNFGDNAYTKDGLNRTYLADIVFNDKNKLKVINSIVHPEVHNHFKEFLKSQKCDYLLFENAILFENGSDKFCDYIITVTAPLETKIDRILKRDKTTREAILARINNQLSDKEKIKKSDFVIANIDLESTKRQVVNIHQQLIENIQIDNNLR